MLFHLAGFAQHKDKYQADSVFKVNKVKTRSAGSSGYSTVEVTMYDKEGRLVQSTTVAPGNHPISSTEYTYDKTGKQTGEVSTLPDSIFVEFEYDQAGRVKQKNYIKTNSIMQLPFKTTIYNYDQRMVAEGDAGFGSAVIWQHTTTYDENNNAIRFTGYDTRANSKARQLEYEYENILDAEGRLAKRVDWRGTTRESEQAFFYNEKGLLIKKVVTTPVAGTMFTLAETFTYTFW